MAERFVGLDIGTSAIRAAEVTVGDGPRPILESYGQVGLQPGTVVDGEIRDRQQVVQALQRLWREGGFVEKHVTLGIAGLRAITRELDMPPLPVEELDSAVRFQADQVVPFPIDQTAISSKIIAQYTDAEGSPQIRVLVAAAHRELIDAATGAIEEAGLIPVGIDLNTAALARALYDPSFTGGPEAIVSVGAGLTMVVVHQAGQLQFVRTIDLGGNNVTKAVASALDLPIADAEIVKRRLGEPGLHDSRAESAAAGAVDELVGEIHNSIRFFSSLPGRGAPARLLVTGAGARTAGFLPKLQAGIDIPVVPASPLSMVDSRLPISPEEAAAINPTLAVPVGLALPDPSGRPFNLLPKEVTAKYATKRIYNYIKIAAAALVVIMIGLSVWRYLGVQSAQNNVNNLTAENNKIVNTEIPKYNKTVRLKSQVTSLQKSELPLVSGEVDMLVVLNAYSQEMPAFSVASSMNIAGTAASPGATAATTKGATGGTIIGTGTANMSVANLTEFTTYGNTMDKSTVFNFAPPTTGITLTGAIGFTSSFSINTKARSHRLSLFDQAVP
jgi:type IV pilus assembly protein PilM